MTTQNRKRVLKKKKKKDVIAGGNYTILWEYIKCVLPPLTKVMGPVN